MVERGRVSSLEGSSARVTVPERMDSVTKPLYIARGALDEANQPPQPGTPVAFVEFPDGSGVILARLEG
ncbi:hypothetical protein ACH6CV_14435 [Bacillota bacterium Meth-B3]